jgi:hypothetical protein
MQESCTYGSVRGAPSNGRPYRNPGSVGVRRRSISYFPSGLVDTHPFGPEALKHHLERALRYSILGLGKALVLGVDHDHELAAAGHQLLETDHEIVRQRSRLGCTASAK